MNSQQVYRVLRNYSPAHRKAIKQWLYHAIRKHKPNLSIYNISISHTKLKVSDMTIEIEIEIYDSYLFQRVGYFLDTDDTSAYYNHNIGILPQFKYLESDFYAFLATLDRKRKIESL
jgi:hypothetical protein